MCARYTMFATPEQIAGLFDLEIDEVPAIEPHYNIAPTQWVPIITEAPGEPRSLKLVQWGFVPAWAEDDSKAMINARAETAIEKPMFRAAMKRRRCLVPTNGFYEWRTEGGKKQPYFIGMKTGDLFAFAGVWEAREEWETGAILTTSPNELVGEIHDRMPVIVPKEDYADWLNPKTIDAKNIAHLLRPFPSDKMSAVAVDRRVGNPRLDDPGLIESCRLDLF